MNKNEDLKKEIGNKFTKLFKEFVMDILQPFMLIIKGLLKFYNTFFVYFKDHKELVIVVTYSLGLLLQLFFLYISFGIEGLSFISIKFSLILLVILFFLSFLSFPVLLLFFLFLAILMFVGALWLAIGLGIIFLIIGKFFPNLFEGIQDKFNNIENKMGLIYISSTILIIIVFGASFISQFSIQKPIELLTEKQGKIMGQLLFYNQDYFFINSCNEKIIIPSNQVLSTHFLCLIKECSEERTIFINQSYKNYCSNLMNKK